MSRVFKMGIFQESATSLVSIGHRTFGVLLLSAVVQSPFSKVHFFHLSWAVKPSKRVMTLENHAEVYPYELASGSSSSSVSTKRGT